MSQVVGLPNNSYKPITNTAWVRARLCKLQKRCTRLTAASDKVYQLFTHGRWFSPGTPASSTTKTGRHDIAEILLKVALKHQKSIINQSIIQSTDKKRRSFYQIFTSILSSLTSVFKHTNHFHHFNHICPHCIQSNGLILVGTRDTSTLSERLL